MAEDRGVADGEYRRHPPPVLRNAGMAHGVDAPMDWV